MMLAGGKVNMELLADGVGFIDPFGSLSFTEDGQMRIDGRPRFETWEAAGGWLRTSHQHLQWWIGEWVTYGEGAYGERVSQAVDVTEWKDTTVLQYARVARQVPPENRRSDLSFSHHREVADLPPDEQATWLAKAASGDGQLDPPWSSDRLRAELRRVTNPEKTECWLLVRCATPADRDALSDTLRAQGREVKLP